MQTTLLGLAMSIILALVAALVAPLVVDWNQYRSAFETEAGRLTGLPVRVKGTIDARLLPTPRITLHDVEVGAAGGESPMRAGLIELEVGLGPLLRGEVHVTELHVVAPQISLGLDRSGAIDWRGGSPSLHLDELVISHLNIEDGRVILSDAASGSRLVLRKLWLHGDIGSFGPFQGEGAFVARDELYSFRLSGNRADANGGVRLTLGVDPSDHPLTAEIEGTLTLARGIPQFKGTLALTQLAAATLARGRRVMSDPWRLTGKLRATPAAAALQDLALVYGPEEREVDVNGRAELTFGKHPHLNGTVSAREVDVDRALAEPDVTHRPPFLVVKSFCEAFVAVVRPPMPVAVGVAIGAVTLGGTTIQALHGDMRFDGKGWDLDGFEFRAPGFTDVKLSGRLAGTPQGLAFSGPAALESADLRMLVAWLEGRVDQPSGPSKALSAHGDVTIASDRFALDRLTAVLDRENNVTGRLAYTWAVNDRPATLDAELHAAGLDIDALAAFAKAAVSDGGFEMPHKVALMLDIGKATLAGVDARMIAAQVKFDAGTLHIDRLSVGDLGGAALDISGRIDELPSRPRGSLTLDLDAGALGGLADLVDRFTPQQAADVVRRLAVRLAPAKVRGVLTIDRAASAGSIAKLDVAGQLGAMRLALNGVATGEPAQPAAAVVHIDGRLDADDGGALTRLFGLDNVLAVDQLPGQLTISAAGQMNRNIHVNVLAAAGGFSAAAEGMLHLNGQEVPAGSLQVKASAADLGPLHRALTGQAGAAAVPISASANLGIAGTALSFTDLTIAAGKATLRGRVGLKLSSPIGIDGDVEADDTDAAALAAMLFGLPGGATAGGGAWSTAPVGAGAFAAMKGSLAFRLDRAALTPALIARDLTGIVRFAPPEIALDDIAAGLAGGRLTGALTFRHDAKELAAQGHMELTDANAGAILASLTSGKNAVDGRITVKLQGDSFGLSPDGLIDSLHGDGTIRLTAARFAGLDTAAFDAAIHAADVSGAADAAPKIRAAVSAAMQDGRLAVPDGDANVTITGGQIRLADVTLQAQGGAELSLAGTLDLDSAVLDARMTLSGRPAANALIRVRPELAVDVEGPLAAPERTLDISALMGWLELRGAELQTRRLESIEANRRADVSGPVIHPASPSVRFVPPGTALESAFPASASAGPGPGARGFERLHSEQPLAAPEELHPNHGAATSALPSAAAATDDAALPRSAPAQTAPPHSAAPTPPAPPASPTPTARSLLDLLFRSQN